MDRKNIYEDLNNIITDEYEFDNINVSMNDIQKSKLKRDLKKNIKTRKFVKSKIAIACASSLIFLVGIGYVNPAFASQIPILNSIIDVLGSTGDYAKYSDIVNKTVTYNEKSFTINSVVCFDNNIIIGYTAKSNKKIDSTVPLFFPTFNVNGKRFNGGNGGLVKNLNENTVMGTIELISTDTVLPDNFKFEMSFEKFNETVGNWDMKFNISKKELNKNTKFYTPNQIVTYDRYNFSIVRVIINPLTTAISFHSKSDQLFPCDWIVLDDEGNELSKRSGAGKQSSDGFNSTSFYSKINANTKYLTVIPSIQHELTVEDSKIISFQGPEDVSVPIDTTLPFEMSEGKNSKVTLTKISFSNDKDNVSIQGIINGKLPNHQTIFLEGDNPKANISLLNTTIKKVDTDKYEFTKEYSGLKNDKNYRLIAPNLDYYINYDSRITVMLNN
ncbi:MAG: DUF4179 domain-containing protein [Clostridiaceae bacterium]|nr:DUF4179 domain-containing protein [Clostridiaceae bacterium]